MYKHYLRHHRSSIKNILLLCILSFSSANLSANQSIDKVIATIGEDIIFSSELQEKYNQAKAQLKEQGKKFNAERLKKQLLDHLILERLQLNIAKRNNIVASQEEIDAVIKNTKKSLRRQGITFEQYLNSRQLSLDKAIETLKKELIINKIQLGVVNQRIKITEKEVDNFLNSKKGIEWLTPKFRLGHIFLPTTEKNKSQTLKKAQELYKALQSPSYSFERLAVEFSKGPNAAKGGDLGIKKKKDLPELFIHQINTLEVGDITQPFKSDAGVHLLKVIEQHGAKAVIAEQHNVRHILIKATELFTDEEAEAKIKQLHTQILNGKDFSDAAKENTDDTGSKLSGGHLGWSSAADFVPNFAKMVRTTPVGEISKPFKSRFGWHILRVEGKRQKDIFEEVKRKQVVKLLRRQRFSDELQIWLKELRANTYVEILI